MIDQQSNSTFAEIYMLDERKFANDSVKALPFSNRTLKRLRQTGVITIMDLLCMTPAKMMKIEGFGIGCLEEIERAVANLDDRKAQETMTISTPVITLNPPTRDTEKITLGDKYGMNPADFADIDVLSMPLTMRASNVLMRNGIKTIGQLLQKTEEELVGLRNFGRTCAEEIDARLAGLREERKPRTRKFTLEECRLMAKGDYSFLAGEELIDTDGTFVAQCMEAQEVLGEELACLCLDKPDKIVPILSVICEFGERVIWQKELENLLKDIPAKRRDNQAIAYINAFTRHENERETLLSLYPTPDAPLKTIVRSNCLDAFSFPLARRFLSWCKYDLQEEISHLFSVLYPNERNQQVIQQRAQKKTLDQIGRQFGLTRERIRQLENKMQRAFNARQGRIKIISKINADKNNVSIVTPANIAEYCDENLQELLFFLRGCESSNFTYDKDLDVFIIGSDSIRERAFTFVEKLPDIIPINDISKFYGEAKEEYDLSREMVDKTIAETYKLTGEVYHRITLSLANIYTEIIREYYPDGINIYDSETITRVRQLILDKYGPVKLPENDRALSARIAGVCILCGRGRYRLKQKQYIPKELAQRICDYIEDSNMVIFMTNILFAVFEEELRKYGVDNKYYLQGILHEIYGEKFTFTRDYISKDPSITSIYPSIVNFIRNSRYPVTKEQLFEHFPGLPEIAISIATSGSEVLTYYGGTFFHVDSLRVSDEEKKYLNSVMESVVADGEIHHTKEVYAIVNAEKPEIFTRNGALYPFSAGSVLEYLFQNGYEFDRPFIAKKGVDISSPSDRLHEFVNKHTMVTVAQISEFIRSSKINVPSLLDLIDECNDRFLLTSAGTLQIIESTGANREIAQRIEMMILSEITQTIRIRDLQCWGQLPTIKIPWTDWLVYSVLKKWGDKVEVAASYPQFRYAIPLVAPVGKMDVSQYAEVIAAENATGQGATALILNLDSIDDILADILTDDDLGEGLWDSEI